MNKYIAPELEIICFESEDVITTSDIEYTTAENESSIHSVKKYPRIIKVRGFSYIKALPGHSARGEPLNREFS